MESIRRTSPLRYLLPVLAVAIIAGAVAVLGADRPPPSVAVAGQSDFAGLVDIGGGRRLFLECRGQGSPTVVLEAGYRNHGGLWSVDPSEPRGSRPMVLPGVAAFTRVCAYDRPGTIGDPDDPADRSRSDPVPQPRTVPDIVADLHALLQAAAVPGPYVLVAHSLGGVLSRLYAGAYPDEVVGLVLVDAGHEDFFVQLRALLTPTQWADVEPSYQGPLDGYPDFERVDLDAGFAQLRRARTDTPLSLMPLTVLSRGRALDIPLPDFPAAELERMWRAQQEDLATLAPNARHTIAGQSAHFIQLEQPSLVIEAIRQVVAGVRDRDTWYDLVSC